MPPCGRRSREGACELTTRHLTAADIQPVPNSSTPRVKTFRADIQGLRAVAVIVVILDHLFGWPAGGFIGVDVFFVISGYLITGLMLREHERTGQISWTGFYRRRIKRILPASTVTLLVTLVAAWFLYRAARFEEVASDAVWSLLFASNWHFAATGTDYLSGDAPPSPLQHFWSLSLEEQFYFVWPLLLIASLGIVGRQFRVRGRSANRFLGAVVIIIGCSSFGWSIYETAFNPTWAYFSTFFRGWELAAGALLAVGADKLHRIPPVVRSLLLYVGLASIGASLFLINRISAFPGPWALLPIVGATLVIVAGIGGPPALSWPLTNPVSVYVGKISYSMYLWHFPVIVLLASVIPQGSVDYILWVVLMIILLSVASYHLIENPARSSSWLEPGNKRGNRTSHGRNRLRTAGYALLCVWTSGTVVVVLLITTQAPATDLAARTAPVAQALELTDVTPAQAQLTADINTALNTADWPELTPSLDALGRPAMAPEWMTDGCLGGEQGAHPDPQENTQRCVYGNPAATKTAVLLGDSIAISYLPGIRAALEPAGWAIKVVTLAQCSFAELSVLKTDGSPNTDCNPFRQWSLDQVRAMHPDLVVLSESPNTLGRLAGNPSFNAAISLWSTGMTSSLTKLVENEDKVVVLAGPPGTGTRDLQKCDSLSKPADCVSSPGGQWHQIVKAGVDVAAQAGVDYVNTEPWFCSANQCPAYVGTTTMFADAGHITAAYSQRLTPVLADVLIG